MMNYLNPLRTYDFENDKILSWFSCGATSAMATYLTMRDYPRENIEILFCDTGSEHESSYVFLEDYQRRFNCEIKILKNEKYADIWDVFEKEKYITSPYGAPCTRLLKKAMRQQYEGPNDIQVFGYDRNEQHRQERLIAGSPEVKIFCPLLEHGLSSSDAKGWLLDQGFELPFMYQPQKSGSPYNHNNCIGCVKGGMGYWNKIRIDFPHVFERMAKLERDIGYSINDVYLDELDPNRGRFEDEPPMSCDMLCQIIMGDKK